MIKIKAKFNKDNDKLEWNYKIKNTNAMEHICVIWNLFDIILEKTPEISEKELIELIKKRKKYAEELEKK